MQILLWMVEICYDYVCLSLMTRWHVWKQQCQLATWDFETRLPCQITWRMPCYNGRFYDVRWRVRKLTTIKLCLVWLYYAIFVLVVVPILFASTGSTARMLVAFTGEPTARSIANWSSICYWLSLRLHRWLITTMLLQINHYWPQCNSCIIILSHFVTQKVALEWCQIIIIHKWYIIIPNHHFMVSILYTITSN